MPQLPPTPPQRDTVNAAIKAELLRVPSYSPQARALQSLYRRLYDS